MADTTGISWTDHTFNPWMGCTNVSPGCENCYAEDQTTNRMGIKVWGPCASQVTNNWRSLLKWDREAKEAGEPRGIFARLCRTFSSKATDRS